MNEFVKEMKENLRRAQEQFNKELAAGEITTPDNIILFGLSREDIAVLKSVFYDAQAKALFCKESDLYDKYRTLYAMIYLQVKGEQIKF